MKSSFKFGIFLVLFLALTAYLYFGTSYMSEDQEIIEKSRALNFTQVSPQLLIADAQKQLTVQQRQELESLQLTIENSKSPAEKTQMMKNLSGLWYSFGRADVAGWYAEQVADNENTAEAWGIAGNTYTSSLRDTDNERRLDFASDRARSAFEKALILDPSNIEYRINQAMTYIYRPKNGPMEGIQMLLELNRNFPDQPMVLRQLARLAIQTGQYDKATKRLRNAFNVKNDKETACMLAEVYSLKNQLDSSAYFKNKCAID